MTRPRALALAVVWVGNDKNEPTGLYGATGAMKVWSALFKKLPSRPLQVTDTGLEYAWISPHRFATTDEGCGGARRYAFVAGFLPESHDGCGRGGESAEDRSWLDWFFRREQREDERAADDDATRLPE